MSMSQAPAQEAAECGAANTVRGAERSSLTHRTLKAIAWRFAGVGTQLVVQMAVMIILARLLSVADFGLASQAMIVVGLATILSECGMAQAIVQRADLTPLAIRVACTLSVLFGATLTLVVWATAGPTAWLLGSPSVAPMIRVVSCTFFIGAFGTTAGALLHRGLEFKKVALAEVASYTLGYAAVALPLAYFGFGVWSLIYAFVSQACVKSLFLVLASPHAMRPSLAREEARTLLHFGVGMSLTRIANYGAHNGDYFVVGRVLGVVPLGLYSRAYQLMNLPLAQISNILTTVLFSSYSSMKSDRRRMARAYLRSVSLLGLVMFPVLICLATVGPELIRGLFGAKWSPAAVPFQILCVAGCLRSMTNAGDSIIRAAGGVYLQARCHSLYALNVVLGTYLGSFGGLVGVSFGVSVAVVVHYALISRLSLGLVVLGWRPYLHSQAAGAATALVVGVVSLLIANLLRRAGAPDLVIVGGGVFALAATWIVTVLAMPAQALEQQTANTLDRVRERMRLVALRFGYARVSRTSS